MVDAARAPEASIIVRTRNRPAMLAGALRDISEQDFADYEVIVVNDGDSTDVEQIVSDSPVAANARVIDRTHDVHGRARAANAGLRAATGRLLVLHDDDDSWDPSFLTRAVGFLRSNPDAAAVSAHTEVVIHRVDVETGEDRVTERLLLTPDLRAITIPDMAKANRITTHSLVYRASVHAEIGYFDESLPAHEDWEFYLRLIARHAIELLPLPALAFWHHRPDATGDEINSVFALDQEHLAVQERVRDDLIRQTIAHQGWGASMHLAVEAIRTERMLQSILDSQRELRALIDENERRIDERHAAAAERERELRRLLLERTSISSFLRRFRAALRRR